MKAENEELEADWLEGQKNNLYAYSYETIFRAGT